MDKLTTCGIDRSYWPLYFSIFLEDRSVFLTGPGGTGKSFHLNHIAQIACLHYDSKYEELYAKDDSPGKQMVRLSALTGTASDSINREVDKTRFKQKDLFENIVTARTFHSCFLGNAFAVDPRTVPTKFKDAYEMYTSLKDQGKETKHLKKLRLILIDEVSMLGKVTFELFVHIFCEQHSKGDDNETKEDILQSIRFVFAGDVMQLSPVHDQYCFTSKYFPMFNFQFFELNKNMRAENQAWSDFLQRYRLNQLIPSDLRTFYQIMNNNQVTQQGKYLRCLYQHRDVNQVNKEMYDNILSTNERIFPNVYIRYWETLVYILPKKDEGSNKTKEKTKIRWVRNDMEVEYLPYVALNKNEQRLLKQHVYPNVSFEQPLELKTNVQVMLTKNLSIAAGLINGSIGTVMQVDDDCIWIQFDNQNNKALERILAKDKPTFGFRIKRQGKVKNDFIIGVDTSLYYTPFDEYRDLPTKYQVDSEQENVRRKCIGFYRFPLQLAFAVTVHKSQGMSLNSLFIDFTKLNVTSNNNDIHSLLYVAISRCKTQQGCSLSMPVASFKRLLQECSPNAYALQFELDRQSYTNYLPTEHVDVTTDEDEMQEQNTVDESMITTEEENTRMQEADQNTRMQEDENEEEDQLEDNVE